VIGLAQIETNIFRGRLVAGRGHVEPLDGIGLVAGARLVEIIVSIGKLRGEFGDEFDADFIAARADRRTKRGEKTGRFAAEFESHTANRFLGDAREGPAPTGMNNSDDTLLWVDDENGDTIGSLHAEQQARGICEGRVALGWLGSGLREKMNDVGVNLLQRNQGKTLGGKSGLEKAAIFCYGRAGIPLHEAEIQNFFPIEEAGTAETSAEAVN